jgi:hypothetical protein
MRKQKKQKLLGGLNGVSSEPLGESLYLRPFERDLEIINEIARATGEKKSAIAQKLLRLALREKQFEFADSNEELNKKLDWVINNEKHKRVERDVSAARIERLEEHARLLEKQTLETAEHTRFTKIISSEIYCVSVISMSILNQIFTKIIEYFSPVEIERENSTDFANRNILGLIEHSLMELENLSDHHELVPETIDPELLYLFTKIEKIKKRLVPLTDGKISRK